MRRLGAWFLAILVGAGAAPGPGARGEDAPAPRPTAPETPLEALRSPFLGVREAALRSLLAGLPGTAEAARRAFASEASPGVAAALAAVLATDGTDASLGLLFEAVARRPEPTAARVRLLLARTPERSRAALATWARERGLAAPLGGPLGALEDLLLAAEVEAVFLSRKSSTGFTGTYKNQYAPLDTPERRQAALRLALHVLEDRAMPVAGLHRAGEFELLHPPQGVDVEFAELQDMAGNAVVELARPNEVSDAWVLPRLDDLLALRRAQFHAAYRAYWRGDSTHGRFLAMLTKRAEYADVLLARVLLGPSRSLRREMDSLLGQLEGEDAEVAAGLLLRLGRYEDAVRAFVDVLRSGSRDLSLAHLHYNLACAYASWSLDPGPEDPSVLRGRAAEHIALAVQNRWSDVGWMEQDRDLDPIRDTDGYRAAVEHIRKFILPPEAPRR